MVIERVGQPVAKVVNPLGTVITVSADEEDVSFSQDYDPAEETTPEPPRSVCAEEGPASLGDFDSEGKSLRSHTEICAEMRPTNEPAIDSVPDESIKEVKEKKSLCAEAAEVAKSSIFEREDSFRDVPTSLSLCAQQGEIPNSPMSQAREHAWRSQCENQERNFAKAKYVVNYDEDSVVLMENKSGRRKTQRKEKKPEKGERKGKKDVKNDEPKYLLRESEDSIVVEDLRENKKESDEKNDRIEEKERESEKVKLEEASCDSFETIEESLEKPPSFDLDNSNLLTLDRPDEFSSIEYHMVDMSSHQSDDDIEHIQVSDNLEKNERILRKCSKSTISDDDLEHIHTAELLEETHKMEESNKFEERQKSEEKQELKEYQKFEEMIKEQKKEKKVEIEEEEEEKVLKSVLSSDDDIEHVLHSELEVLPLEDSRKEKPRSKRRKDILVIDTVLPEAEVTLVKPIEGWNKSKTLEKDLAEEIDRCDPKLKEEEKKQKKVQVQKRQSRVEIIDIDAMQKAEVVTIPIPECKILEGASRKKKRGKKGTEGGNESLRPKPQSVWNSVVKNKDGKQGTPAWSCIVKRKNKLEDKDAEVELQFAESIHKEEVNDQKIAEVSIESSKPSVELSSCVEDYQAVKEEENVFSVANVETGKDTKLDEAKDISETISDFELKEIASDTAKKNDCSNKKSDPEPEKKSDSEPEKRSDSEPENVKENSSSSDDPNSNVVPMDTEEDGAVKETVDKVPIETEVVAVTRKQSRSKKKRRR